MERFVSGTSNCHSTSRLVSTPCLFSSHTSHYHVLNVIYYINFIFQRHPHLHKHTHTKAQKKTHKSRKLASLSLSGRLIPMTGCSPCLTLLSFDLNDHVLRFKYNSFQPVFSPAASSCKPIHLIDIAIYFFSITFQKKKMMKLGKTRG